MSLQQVLLWGYVKYANMELNQSLKLWVKILRDINLRILQLLYLDAYKPSSSNLPLSEYFI